ncbi:hypothetical protein C1646_768466 [Rhizophagus diaphanus]|nr:hypothetical protein C1646_768466 [Rhizophagus diaphanus] [Rhizophagus sp. MUCL 43196]
MNTNENYIGYEALISYLNEPRNWSYHGFLKLNKNTIIASLTQLTTNTKWQQSFDITWNKRFLNKVKQLLDSNTFVELKKKVNTEHSQRKKELQIFWQEVIKEYEKNQKIIKECEKENKFTTPIKLTETLQSKENTFTTVTSFPKKSVEHSETLQKDASLLSKKIVKSSVKNISESSQLDLSKENIKLTNFCYDIFQDRQTRKLKRIRDNDTDDTDRSWKKQIQILEQNKNNLIYRQVINDALLVASAYESLVKGNIIPLIEILKTFLLTRSRMSLSSANESMLQAIVENLLPLKYRIPELSLIMDGKKLKGSGRFGYSDIFVLKGTGDIYISLELKYISLVGLIKNQKVNYGANELENLDKILEKEDEEILLKRPYTYWSKEHKRTNQTTIGEVLNSGIRQLESYMNTIAKGRVADYFSSGIFDERVKIVKSNPNKLKGFVILVIGFRRILWKPVDEVISNYTYNVI